ncbi:MAG: hypothetical protein J6B29_02420 [Clostridia bacterium]|nr:hypothetical protein [Clostridia bacterium]
MKKLFVIALVLIALLALVACGDDSECTVSSQEGSPSTDSSVPVQDEQSTQGSVAAPDSGETDEDNEDGEKWCRVYTEGKTVYIETEIFGDEICGRISHRRIPLVQMLKALGATAEKRSDTVTVFNLYGEEYTLDTERKNLFDSQGKEELLPVPGSSHTHFSEEGEEVFVDNTLLMHFFMSLEIDAAYDTTDQGYQLVILERNS